MVRIKNRYLLVNILYPGDIRPGADENGSELVKLYQPTSASLTPQVLLKAVRAAVNELFGDYGSGAIAGSLQVKYLSTATSTFILKVSRAHYRIAWAALTFMNSIPSGKPCVFRVVRVSGTIRMAEEEAIKMARQMIIRAKRELGLQSDANFDKLFGGPVDIPLQDHAMGGMNDSDDDEVEGEYSDEG